MRCREAGQLFSAHLDGGLTPAEDELLRAHLAECRACAAEFGLEREMCTVLRESAAVPMTAPTGFARSVTAALKERRRGRLSGLTARWRHGLAAAAFVLIMTASLGYGALHWFGRGPVVVQNDPPQTTGEQVAPPGPVTEREPGTDPGAGEPGAEREPGSMGKDPGAGSGKPGETGEGTAPDAGDTGREPDNTQIAAGTDPEPVVFLNKPRTISTTFVRLDVADLNQTREKAWAAAKNHGATGQVQDAQAGASNMTLRFDVDPARADDFVTRLRELGLSAKSQTDQWEITGEFAATLEDYQALVAQRERTEDPDARERLDKEICELEQRLTEWNRDAERHIVVLMLQQS